MLRSMTGYGKASLTNKKGCYEVEVQSINRKFLESAIFLPKEFISFEIEIKRAISKKIFRGQVTFRLNFYPSEDGFQELLPSIKILKSLKMGWEEIAKKLKLEKKKVDLYFLMQQLKFMPRMEMPKDLTLEKKIVFKCLDKALVELISMKKKEGKALSVDIDKRLNQILNILPKIKKKSKDATRNFAEKLKERLSSFLSEELKTDERILREIAIYAEKLDITEEMIRLKSHIEQFNILLKDHDIVGRKMDFLLQEMLREANTIASKSSDKDISKYIVDIKSELEKIREQVQNIE